MLILRMLESFIITWLAAGLLYLYYNGAWVESIAWIRYSELLFQWMLVLFGMIRAGYILGSYRRYSVK